MIIPEGISIILSGDNDGSIEIFKHGKRIYHAEGVNSKRATHFNFIGSDSEDDRLVAEILNEMVECSNYVGASQAKHDKWG